MNFAFTDEQEELRATARSFLAEHSASEAVRRAMESELGYEPEVWKRISAELGWPAILIPEAYGGLGLGWVELVALLEPMGEALLCAPFFSSVCLGQTALLVAGSEEQKREHLPALAEGDKLASLAHPEPSARWEADGIETLARPSGSDFVLSGRKRFVLDGHCADLLIVPARLEGSQGQEGVSLFLVDAAASGITRRVLPTMDQTRRLAEIEFDNVTLPASTLLGEAGEGWSSLQALLHLASVGLAAEQVGGAQRCLDMSVEYAKERIQFDRPIGSFQAIQHKCADMMVRVEAARSASYYAACVAAEGSDELSLVAALAKAYCSDAFFHCAGEAIQIHGGVGFTWEYDVHLYFKRAKSSEIFLGSPTHHRERVAQAIGL